MSNPETRYCFSADHVNPKFRFIMESIRVTSDTRDGKIFYGSNHDALGNTLSNTRHILGNHATPESAIRELLKSANCFNIQIHEIKPKPARALLDIENRAIAAIAAIGLDVMGGDTPADLLTDNMTHFDFQDLARALKIKESDAAAIMFSLEGLGFVSDTGENQHWTLTDSGIGIAADLAAEKIADDFRDQMARDAIADNITAEIKADESADGIVSDSPSIVSISGYRDNRNDADISDGGVVVPLVTILFTDKNYKSASIPIDAETARKLAIDLLQAADAVDNGADYSGADYPVSDTDSDA